MCICPPRRIGTDPSHVNLRAGQLQQIYESRKNIARHFQAHRQYDVATRYYQDALQTAQMIQDDRDFETEATKNIGYMLEITGTVLLCYHGFRRGDR